MLRRDLPSCHVGPSRGKPARMRGWHPRAHALRDSVVCDRLIANGRATQHGPFYRRARACPSPSFMNREIAGDRPPRYGPGRKNARGTDPRAALIERSRGTGPRATVFGTAIPAFSTHQTSSASDLQQKQDPATTASLTSPAYHPTRLPRSDSNTQSPASPRYP